MARLLYIFRCILQMDYKALFKTVHEVHKLCGKNRIYLFFDIIVCGFRYGAGYMDYLLCEFFNLSAQQRATYVTRGINNSIAKKLNNADYYHLFNNKNEFYELFSEYIGREWLDFTKADESEFVAFMQGRESIICKPLDACCGVGIEKLHVKDFDSLSEMYGYLRQRNAGLVEEVVVQHPAMSKINDSSVNTIRVYTVLYEGVSNVAYACIRMGNSDRPVDNINAGGMYSPVDLQTGKISCVAYDKNRNVYTQHPRTGCPLVGYQIPYWDAVMDLCRKAAYKVPQMGYVGWDVAITENGPLFIEANNLPGHDAFPQMPMQAPDKIGMLPVFKSLIKDL